MSNIQNVVILSACRTAIGRFGGGLKTVSTDDLGALVIGEAAKRADISASDIESAVIGNVLRTKSNDAYISRICAVNAGMTNESHAVTVNRLCGSGLEVESHKRAVNAIEKGYFKDQIVPVEIKSRKGSTIFEQDEHARADASVDGMSGLRPAFKKDGSVTAGNASGLNDGASAIILASEDWASENGKTPMARIVSYARAGVDPSIMGTGPIPAVRIALEKAKLLIEDIDIIESNEAFAAQACAVAQELGFPDDKTNPNGGAVGLGHPIGATGAILCIGGGQGIAAIVERL